MTPITFHLLPNAHLDPVWLWDWREGFNEGISTCRTMLEMMRENDDFTFMRGEASIYLDRGGEVERIDMRGRIEGDPFRLNWRAR